MAITRTTTASLPANQVPTGYTPPAFTEIVAPDIDKIKVFTVAVIGTGHADNAVTGLTALVAAVDTAAGTYADTDLHLDAADTVTLNVKIINIERVSDTWSKDDSAALPLDQQYILAVESWDCRCHITAT